MDSTVLSLQTGRSRALVDITAEVAEFVSGRGDGLVSVFLPHATAGLAVMESGSGSETDLMDRVDALLPRTDQYRHRHGSPGHGADHLLPAFLAPSLTIPVVGGSPALGTWQSIVVVDLNVDNPQRQVRISFLAG